MVALGSDMRTQLVSDSDHRRAGRSRCCNAGTASLAPCPSRGHGQPPTRNSRDHCAQHEVSGRSHNDRPVAQRGSHNPRGSTRTERGCGAELALAGLHGRQDSLGGTAVDSAWSKDPWSSALRRNPNGCTFWRVQLLEFAASEGRRNGTIDGSGLDSNSWPRSAACIHQLCIASRDPALRQDSSLEESERPRVRAGRTSELVEHAVCSTQDSDAAGRILLRRSVLEFLDVACIHLTSRCL